MTESPAAPGAASQRWTCPFCLLLCDDLEPRAATPGSAGTSAPAWELARGHCAPARAALAQFTPVRDAAAPLIDGRPGDLPAALHAAARWLVASRQPLFGGLGTDVAGARALYPLACATGAICDAAGGAELMHGVRALQDRGGFTTTLAEVRNRADVIVCLGGLPAGDAADFFVRCGLGEALVAQRHVVVFGGEEGSHADAAGLAALQQHPGIGTEWLPLEDDLFTTLALLAAQLAGRAARGVPAPLAALAARLRAARYSVVVGEARRWPEHGALLIEAVDRIVATLNTETRAAAFWLGGGNGAGSVNQVFTWLSGLPLRSRAGPCGLEHEPVCFDAARLLADGAVDSVLWISSFDAACVPPATALPLIVLGPPAMAAAAARAGSIFIPVATPGLGAAGHLFRADGGVVVPLTPLFADTLPGVAEVLRGLTLAVHAARNGVAA